MYKNSFRKKLILLFFLGLFSTFSIIPFKIYPLILCFSYAIHLIMETKKFSHTFFLAFFFSFGWFLSGLYWIGNSFLIKSGVFILLMPIAITLLPLFLAFFWGCVFLISKYISKKIGEIHLNFVIILSIWEYIRGNFLEFPWLMPGDYFSSNNYSLQAFSYLGSFSMNAVLLLCLVLPIIIFKYKKKSLLIILLFIFPVSFLFLKSYFRYESKNIDLNPLHKITIIQPNIKQEVKWRNSLKNYHYNMLKNLSKRSNEHKSLKFNTKLIIWPETAFVGLFPRDRDILFEISQSFLNKNKKEYLFTGLVSKSEKSYFNSAILLDSNGNIENKYDKNILVPFGEYLPLNYLIPKFNFLQNKIDFSKGKLSDNFSINGNYSLLPLICYEIIFSKLISKSINSDTSLLLNITNDAWFGDTIGPHQHFQFAKIRAVEFGLPIVRVANTGISGFISPYGNVIKKIDLNERGILSINLVKKIENTLFKTYGNKILILLIIFIFVTNILFSYTINKKRFNV